MPQTSGNTTAPPVSEVNARRTPPAQVKAALLAITGSSWVPIEHNATDAGTAWRINARLLEYAELPEGAYQAQTMSDWPTKYVDQDGVELPALRTEARRVSA